MLELPPTPGWMALAACHGRTGFYPGRGDHEGLKLAKKLCHTCVVKAQCLEYALAAGEHYGIWGGTSELERRKIRRRRKAEQHDGGVTVAEDLVVVQPSENGYESDDSYVSAARLRQRSHRPPAEVLQPEVPEGCVPPAVTRATPGRPGRHHREAAYRGAPALRGGQWWPSRCPCVPFWTTEQTG
jgi:WhiB family redox-sensing transcriptional regulator